MSHFLVFALHPYVSYVQSHHFPWLQPHELQSIRSSRLTEHIIRYHVSLGEVPWLPHMVFSPKGLLLSGQGAVDHIRGKGLSSCLTSGSKIRLTAGFEPCPQGPVPNSFNWSTPSLLMCTLFCAFTTCVSCITFFLGLAASQPSKDPPSLAYWLFASPQLNSVRWCCGVALNAKTTWFHGLVHPIPYLTGLCSFFWLGASTPYLPLGSCDTLNSVHEASPDNRMPLYSPPWGKESLQVT